MIRRFAAEGGRLRQVEDGPEADEKVAWYDLLSPSREEEEELERLLGVNVPTREEMEEIEVSSRLYYEDNAAFMTATLPAGVDANVPQIAPVTFVLAADRLITVRFHEPQAFRTFPLRTDKLALPEPSAAAVLAALLDVIIDRLADILERVGRDIDLISQDIFQHPADARARGRDFQKILGQIGRQGDLSSNVRDSLVTLERMFGFLAQYAVQRTVSRDVRGRIRTLTHDARSLIDYASYLSQKITFLLDATLGMVNIEQNATIKIFSVAAVVFLPPTLIASIYGMNFEHMPELEWLFGYPFAVGVMLASAILPYLYFKRRGWL